MAKPNPDASRNGVHYSEGLMNLGRETARKIGLSLPIENYKPYEQHPICKSASDFASQLRATIPSMAATIDLYTSVLVKTEIEVNQLRGDAFDELMSKLELLLSQTAAARERQPEYLKARELLEQQRASLRLAFASAAAVLGLVLNPDTVTSEAVIAALRGEPDYGPRPIPIPGKPSAFLRAIKRTVPSICGVTLGLALAVLTGTILPSDLQNIDLLSPSQWTVLSLFCLVGGMLDQILASLSGSVFMLGAEASFQVYVPSLPKQGLMRIPARIGLAVLILILALFALLEGVGLHQIAEGFALVEGETPLPMWVFLLIGGAINGAIIAFSGYVSFIDHRRELAASWPWKNAESTRPALTEREASERQNLMAAACELMDLNAKLSKLDQALRVIDGISTQTPDISPTIRKKLEEAEAKALEQTGTLRELVVHIARRTGTLTPLLNMGEIEVPTKMVLLPFLNMWLHLRGKRSGDWPGKDHG